MRLRVGWVQVFSFVLVGAKNGFVWYLTFGNPTGVGRRKRLPHQTPPDSMVARRGSADRAGWAKAVERKRDKKLEFGDWFSRALRNHFRGGPGHRESTIMPAGEAAP